MSLGLISSGGPILASLRLSPLVGSTALITGIIDQQIAFSTFAEGLSSGKQSADDVIPSWLYYYAWRVIRVAGTAYPATMALAGLNLLVDPGNVMSRQTKQLYAAGFVLTTVRGIPYKYATRLRKSVWTKKGKVSEASAAMAEFAWFNGVRLWVLDLPAWFFIFAAVISQCG